MTVYLYQAGVRLVIPPNVPLPTHFTTKPEPTHKHILLMMHPFDYVKTMWMAKTQASIPIKQYVMCMLQTPQSSYLPNPDATIRLEWFKGDMKQLGLTGTIAPPNPPQQELCMSSSAMIRRLFHRDFELGDYE